MSTITQRATMGTMNFGQMWAHEARLNGLHQLFKTQFNVPEPSLILQPYLFLGNCISAHDVYRLSRLGIRYILNVAKRDVELCPYYSKDTRVLTIDLRDDDQENILRTFDQAFAFIDEARKNNSRVLVHCSHGQSRSPAIVIAYLMRTYHVPLEQCLTHVVKARPCVIPNDGFLKQLILFDRVLVERRRQHQLQRQQQQQQQYQKQQQQQQQQQQQKAATPQATKSIKSTEIPIQRRSPVPPHPVPPLIPAKLISSSSSDSSATNVVNIPAVSSLSMRIPSKKNAQSSGSSLQPSTSTKSMQFVPIQVAARTERSPEKVKRVSPKKPAADKEGVSDKAVKKTDKSEKSTEIKSTSKSSHKSRLKMSTSHSEILLSKRKSSTKKTTDVGLYFPQMHRSRTDNSSSSYDKHHNKPHLSRPQVHYSNSYPADYYGSIGHVHANYITEIYDRVAKRFVPATSCY